MSLRKWIAWILGVFVAFSMGYVFLPKSFGLMVGWLAPLFGTSFRVVLSVFYIMLGDPLRDNNLIILWASTGFIAGLIVRRKVGGVIASLSIYPTLFIFMGLAGYRIFQIVQGIGLSPEAIQAALPPTPRGTTLATVLNAPIVSDFYRSLSGRPLQALSTTYILSLVTSFILPSVAKNLGILLVSSVVGGEIGRQAAKLSRAGSEKMRLSLVKRLVKAPTPTSVQRSKVLVLVSLLLLTVLISALVTANYHRVTAAPEFPSKRYYSESLLGFVLPTGTALIAASFIDTDLRFVSTMNLADPAFSDCLTASLITQDIEMATVSLDISAIASAVPGLEPYVGDLPKFYSIAPKVLFIVVYRDISLDVALSRAERAADIFYSTYGAPLSLMFTQEIPADGHNLVLVLYQSDREFDDGAFRLMESIPWYRRGGLSRFTYMAYTRGMFTPGRHRLSSNGTVISAGLISMEASLFPALGPVKPFLPPISGLVPYLSLGSVWGGYFHSSPQIHSLKFGDILNTTEVIEFSPEANASTIAAVVPEVKVTETGEKQFIPKASIVTTLPVETVTKAIGATVKQIIPTVEVPIETIEKAVTVTQVETGGTVEEAQITVTFEYRFPLVLKVTKALSVTETDRHGVVTVTITIHNNDTDAGDAVRLDDSRSLSYYPQSARLVEGTLRRSWDKIPGKSSLTHTYKIRVDKEGMYTLPSATVSYIYAESPYTATSNLASLVVRSPSIIQIFVEGAPLAWRMAVNIINLIPQAQGMGETILIASLAAIVILIVLIEYRGFRRWLRGPKPKREATT